MPAEDSNAPPVRPPKASLTIVIPAFNEAGRLRIVVEETLEEATRELEAFEIIVIDDGSSDDTGKIADLLSGEHPGVVLAVHHPTNRGVGAAYATGLAQARYPRLTLIPGDRAFEPSGIGAVFRAAATADVVISYRQNPGARTPVRRALSRICSALLRAATRCPIRDGHSMYVWPVEAARRIEVPQDYRYHLVSLVTLMQEVESFVEVPVTLTPKPDYSSGVMRPKVVIGLGLTMMGLLLRTRFSRAARPPRIVPGLD